MTDDTLTVREPYVTLAGHRIEAGRGNTRLRYRTARPDGEVRHLVLGNLVEAYAPADAAELGAALIAAAAVTSGRLDVAHVGPVLEAAQREIAAQVYAEAARAADGRSPRNA